MNRQSGTVLPALENKVITKKVGERGAVGLAQAAPGNPPTRERGRGRSRRVAAGSAAGVLARSQPAPGPDHGLVRAARAARAARASSAQRSRAVAIVLFAQMDMSNGPETPFSPATCICSATGAAAGRRRRPGRHAAGGTEPGAAHRGRAASLTQTPPRRPARSSMREGQLPRRKRHAAAPAHAPLGPFSRGFPRRPPRDGPT